MREVQVAVMKAPGSVETAEFEKPKVEDNCLMLRIELTGVCGTDFHIFKGRLPNIPFPIIPGHEMIARIDELGSKANDHMLLMDGPLRTGDLVTLVAGRPCGTCFYCLNYPSHDNLCPRRVAYGVSITCRDPPHIFGGFAQYMYVLPGTPIFKVPESIPLEVSVLTDPTAVAIRALERAFEPGVPFAGTGFGVGSSVVIQGLGPIGILTAAAAKSAGAGKIIAIDSVDVRLRLAEEFGVDHVIDMRQFTKPEDRVQEVLKLTGKVGADVVIECTGVPSAFGEGIEFARSGGRYVEVGHFTDAGSVEVNPHLICKKDLDILGSWVFPKVTFRKALSLLSQRRFPFEKLVTHRLKVNEVARAFELMERKESGKIVIEPGI